MHAEYEVEFAGRGAAGAGDHGVLYPGQLWGAARVCEVQAQFFVEFACEGLLDGFAGFDVAARQGVLVLAVLGAVDEGDLLAVEQSRGDADLDAVERFGERH